MSLHGKLSVEAEQEAIKIIKKFVGKNGAVFDLSQTQSYDFEIKYTRDKTAIGEITLLADPIYEKAWSALIKKEKPHQIELPEDFGTWGAQLESSANVNIFHSNITSILKELINQEINEVVVNASWPNSILGDQLRNLGIQFIIRSASHGQNILTYFLDSNSKPLIAQDLESLVSKLNLELKSRRMQDLWTKMYSTFANEKHLFLVGGSAIDLNDQFVLLDREKIQLIPDIYFPPGISHIWFKPRFVEAHSILWIKNVEKIILPK